MKTYLTDENGGSEFRKKPKGTKQLINNAICIIDAFGIPVDETPRRVERMALAFLALSNVTQPNQWKKTKSLDDGIAMKSRDIIAFENKHFHETISRGSYDDIRRRDLKHLVLAGLVVRTKPDSARNDPGRGYAISPKHAAIIRKYGSLGWEAKARKSLGKNASLKEMLAQSRDIHMVPAVLPGGKRLLLSPGEHNLLQKEIIEQFIPRFAPGAKVLYIGDSADKFLVKNEQMLKKLYFFKLEHGELPDVVAYLESKNWLYLIEAVHSFGPISSTRLYELKKLTKKCRAGIIYVTAFMDYGTYHKFSEQIAWETEVWIAEKPDHMIHYNGHKFFGPYKSPSKKKGSK